MTTENAGRGIAEAGIALVYNDSVAPNMVMITGNHRIEGVAITAARHLRDRGHRVTVCLLGLEHEAGLLERCGKHLISSAKLVGGCLDGKSYRSSDPHLVPLVRRPVVPRPQK